MVIVVVVVVVFRVGERKCEDVGGNVGGLLYLGGALSIG